MSKQLVGYGDALSVQPGDQVAFKVSSVHPEYRADLVRILHGDENKDGPGFQEEEIPSSISGAAYPGHVRAINPGSYARVPHSLDISRLSALTLAAWIYPTARGGAKQTLIAKLSVDATDTLGGYELFLDESGAPGLWLGSCDGAPAELRAERPCVRREWIFVAATYDGATRSVAVSWWQPGREWETTSGSVDLPQVDAGAGDLLLAAAPTNLGTAGVGRFFNGKLDSPLLLTTALGPSDLQALAESASSSDAQAVARWDFTREIPTTTVVDVIGGHHGTLINTPSRAVTGHDWTGAEHNWRHAVEQYGAIHFHDDDLDDAGWLTDFILDVPSDLRSGVYAVRLRAGDEEDHVPFFVRPPRGTTGAQLALLLPTLTYLAYANEPIAEPHPVARVSLEDEYVSAQRLVSQYNVHSDGSGVAFASRLRPLLSLRPRYRYWLSDSPFGLPADLHTIAWLDHENIPFDVITDEDLHHEGVELLRNYRVVMTGTHPEYVTEPMMIAFEEFVDEGHRLMYMGGNGFFEVTAIDSARPWLTEIRRPAGVAGLWESQPGELHLATTGEQGGRWKNRKLRARSIVGVEFVLQTLEGRPFHRCEASFDPHYSWAFDGVGKDETIGDFGLVAGAAGSIEIDAIDYEQGTPHECVVLARSIGFRSEFTDPHADLAFRPTANGGAVMSFSSIGWCGSLPWNGFNNNVATITRNALRVFLSDESPWLDEGPNASDG